MKQPHKIDLIGQPATVIESGGKYPATVMDSYLMHGLHAISVIKDLVITEYGSCRFEKNEKAVRRTYVWIENKWVHVHEDDEKFTAARKLSIAVIGEKKYSPLT